MSTDSQAFISRSALKFFSGTLLSRISGLLRDMTMAFCFGTAPALAAFFLAYRFVYLIRRLFGEGLLHQGFIPHFEIKRKEDPKKAALFFRDLFWTMVLLLGVLILGIECCLSFFHHETAKLCMWMAPGIFFICLFGLSTGLLQSEKSFFIPSVSPVAFNLVWVFGVLFLSRFPVQRAILGLTVTISIGFFFQWMMTLPKTWAFLRGYLTSREIFKATVFSLELKALIKPVLLGIVGVAAVQINTAIDAVFARYATLEGPAYLWFAIRIQQLPLALFGLALSSALFPSLSRSIEEGNIEKYQNLLEFAKRRTFTLIFPCVIGVFVLGASSVNLLYGRGDFNHVSTYHTIQCLWCYGLGLLPTALIQILAPAFYATKNFRTPTIGFLISAVLNTFLNAILVFYFKKGPESIALATSISAIFNFSFLWYHLPYRKSSHRSMMKTALCALLAGAIVLFLGYFMGDSTIEMWKGQAHFSRNLSSQGAQFGIQTGLYFLLFFTFCRILHVEDVLQMLKRKS